jgi:hypothetical protein
VARWRLVWRGDREVGAVEVTAPSPPPSRADVDLGTAEAAPPDERRHGLRVEDGPATTSNRGGEGEQCARRRL